MDAPPQRRYTGAWSSIARGSPTELPRHLIRPPGAESAHGCCTDRGFARPVLETPVWSGGGEAGGEFAAGQAVGGEHEAGDLCRCRGGSIVITVRWAPWMSMSGVARRTTRPWAGAAEPGLCGVVGSGRLGLTAGRVILPLQPHVTA